LPSGLLFGLLTETVRRTQPEVKTQKRKMMQYVTDFMKISPS
jgi:hypothetical protein